MNYEPEVIQRVESIYQDLLLNEKLIINDHFHFEIEDLLFLTNISYNFLETEPSLLKIPVPCNVIGDLHGQYWDLVRYIQKGGSPSTNRYLFIGDYVDRGKNSIETITHLLCLKILYPNNVFLLRGNHETRKVSSSFGFYEECENLYSVDIWNEFNNVFDYLPIAALISNTIFCVHGGISPELETLSQIDEIQRPIDVPEKGIVSDLIWNDPLIGINGYLTSRRGVGYSFGHDVTTRFLKQNNISLICRAHQVVQKGYEYPFEPNSCLLTIFSATNYLGTHNNQGAMLILDQQMKRDYFILEPYEFEQQDAYSGDGYEEED